MVHLKESEYIGARLIASSNGRCVDDSIAGGILDRAITHSEYHPDIIIEEDFGTKSS